jgi:uncharacterized protein (TIGR02145 family)
MKTKTATLEKILFILCLIFLFFSTGYAQIKINGVCWATRNVDMPGTFSACPEDAGMFYQWGSNVGWSTTDPLIASDGINIYRNLSQNGSVWLPEKNPCPTGWRVPTRLEYLSLISTNSYWGNLNGINGRFFGNEEPRLFFPGAGYRFTPNGEFGNTFNGFYWSSTPYSTEAYSLFFANSNVTMTNTSFRSNGKCIRCVAEQDCYCSVKFYANNVHFSVLPDTTFCASFVNFRAEMEYLNPDSLKWYVNGVETVSARDSLEWGKNFPNGNYVIEMKASFEDCETIIKTCILKIQAVWIKMRNIRRG